MYEYEFNKVIWCSHIAAVMQFWTNEKQKRETAARIHDTRHATTPGIPDFARQNSMERIAYSVVEKLIYFFIKCCIIASVICIMMQQMVLLPQANWFDIARKVAP
jgi:hypothetical protein